jgi:hypothetical protein
VTCWTCVSPAVPGRLALWAKKVTFVGRSAAACFDSLCTATGHGLGGAIRTPEDAVCELPGLLAGELAVRGMQFAGLACDRVVV